MSRYLAVVVLVMLVLVGAMGLKNVVTAQFRIRRIWRTAPVQFQIHLTGGTAPVQFQIRLTGRMEPGQFQTHRIR